MRQHNTVPTTKVLGYSPPPFSTPSQIFKRYSSPTSVTPSKNSNVDLKPSHTGTTPSRLESPTNNQSLNRYQPRLESPSEKDEVVKYASPMGERTALTTFEKNSRDKFVLLDQDDFSKGIEVIRTKIDSIEDEMKSMQSQYSRFQEKEFSSGSDKLPWKSKRRNDYLQSLDLSIKNEKLDEVHHLISVYRTGLKQNIFDFKDVQLRNAVDNATKLFQEKLNFIQSLDNLENEIQHFLTEIYNSIDTHISEAVTLGDDKLRLRIEHFEKVYTTNLRLFSTHFGKETSSKVNKTQKMIDESLKIVEMISSFVKSIEKGNQHDLEMFYSKIPTEMVRLLKLTHNCLSSFARAVEKTKELSFALSARDINQVKLISNSFTNEIERLVAIEPLKEAQSLLSQYNSDQDLLYDKERRKIEVVQRIKNIIEKSETFSVEKQQKFTQILLESGIRDPTVLRELRIAWETKKNIICNEKVTNNKELILDAFKKKIQAAIQSRDVNELEEAIIVPDGIKSEVEKWQHLRLEAKVLLDSLLLVSVEELDIKLKLDKMLETRDLSDFEHMEKEIKNDFKNPEILIVWNKVLNLQEKQEISFQKIDLSLGSNEFRQLLSDISSDCSTNFIEKQWKLWEYHHIKLMENQFEEALLEKDEKKLKDYIDTLEKEQRLKPFFISSLECSLDVLRSIQDCRYQLEEAIISRERSCLEKAVSKGKRFSNSLVCELETANRLLNTIEKEEDLLNEYCDSVKTKDIEKLRTLIVTILQNNSELKIDDLLERAKQTENEMQSFIHLKKKLEEKDFPTIVLLLQTCKDCTEFDDKVLIAEAEYLIDQNENSKKRIVSQFHNIHKLELLERYMENFKDYLSSQDLLQFTDQWKEFTCNQLDSEFKHVVESGDEALLILWNERVARLIEGGLSNSNLLELQEQSTCLLAKMKTMREFMKDSITMNNITSLEGAIDGIISPFLDEELRFIKNKLENFHKLDGILRDITQALENRDCTVASIEKMLKTLADQEPSMVVLDVTNTLIKRKQAITEEHALYVQLTTELGQKNSNGYLADLLEPAKTKSGLAEICSTVEDFLQKQNEYRKDIRDTLYQQQQSECKKIDELVLQKYHEYLPVLEVELYVKNLKEFNEQREKFNNLAKLNEQFISKEIELMESKLKEIHLENKNNLVLQKITLEDEHKSLLEIERGKIEAEIQHAKERYKSELEKLTREGSSTTKQIRDEFLTSKEIILHNSKQEYLLLKQQLEEQEKLVVLSAQENLELTHKVENIKQDISEKVHQNEEMKSCIKYLEEDYSNALLLGPKLADKELELNESISKIEERVELQKENIRLLQEKIVEQDLMLQEKISYKQVMEEELAKKKEEIEKQLEEQEKLVVLSAQENLELTHKVEKIKHDISEKVHQNEEMKSSIKYLEENYSNALLLGPKLADKEVELNESISKIEERVELQKENIRLLQEKIEEQDLMLREKISYKQVTEEELAKKKEEIEKQLEEMTLQIDVKNKSLLTLGETKKDLECSIASIGNEIDQEEQVIKVLSYKKDQQLQNLEDLKNNKSNLERDLEVLQVSIKQEEENKNSLQRLKQEQLEHLDLITSEKLELEGKLQNCKGMEVDLNVKLGDLISLIDEKNVTVSKYTTDIDELEKTHKEKEEECSRLIENRCLKMSLISQMESNLRDETLNLEMLTLKEEEASATMQELIKKKKIKEEEEKQLKDKLLALEEDIKQTEKNNSDKSDIIEKLKDNSKFKTLEKLEMLKKLEEEEDRSLQESIMREEKLLNQLKEGNIKNKKIEEELEKDKLLLQSKQIECSEKVKIMENDIARLEHENKELETSSINKNNYLLQLNSTMKIIQEQIQITLTNFDKETKLKSNLEMEMSERSSQLTILREQISSSQTHLQLLKENSERETAELEMLLSNKKELEDNISQLGYNTSKLNSDKDLLQKKLNELNHSQSNTQKEIDLLRELIVDRQAQHLKMQQEMSDLEKSLEEKSDLEEASRKLNENLKMKIAAHESSIIQLQKEKEEKTANLEVLEMELCNFQNSLQYIAQQESDLKEKQINHQHMIKEKENTIKMLETNMIELENNIKLVEPTNQEPNITTVVETISNQTTQQQNMQPNNPVQNHPPPIEESIQQTKEINQSMNNPLNNDNNILSNAEEGKENTEMINDQQNEKEGLEEGQEKQEMECKEKVDKDDNKEKKKAILPSKTNNTPTPPPIEMIDNTLSQLYKKISKGELKMDEENKAILNYDDPYLIEIARQYSIILCDQCTIGNNSPTFLFNIVLPKFVDFLITLTKKETDSTRQNKLRKLIKKLRGFKKDFSELDFPKKLDKEYFTLSILYIYYLNANGIFGKDFWEVFFASNDFLKEFFSPTSMLYNPAVKEDLLFLTKKQSKFKIKNMNLFESSSEYQQSICDHLLIDFPNAPPIESLKSVLAEIKCKISIPEEMKMIVNKKLSRSLLSILEVGFRAFKFFGRYYFWDFVKFYIEKAEKSQGEIKDVHQQINEMVSNSKIKMTEQNDIKFVLFIASAFNKRKLAEWFKKLTSLPQIGDYFTEESIIRSDKMENIILILEEVELSAKSFMVELIVEDMSFNYEKCIWNDSIQ